MSAITIDARETAKAIGIDLRELALVFRASAKADLELASHIAVREYGEPSLVLERAGRLLAAAVACETADDEDNPLIEEDENA
jgi:hypothetical protein